MMEMIQTDDTYLISDTVDFQQEYTNDSPCVGCELVDNCAKTHQACQAYRKYESYGKFNKADIAVKFKGMK